MIATRRIYLVLVSCVSVAMLVVGLANVGGILIEWVLSPGALERTFRQSLALPGALVLVGLPIWALHWSIAQRFARRDGAERASALRRLYLYLVGAGLMGASGVLGTQVVERALSMLLASSTWDAVDLLRSGWHLALVLTFWAYHFRIAARDRASAGETGASATLRRWYAYGVQTVALTTLLFGAQDLLRIAASNLMGRELLGGSNVASPMAQVLVALGIWIFHAWWTAGGPLSQDDRRSTLRAVAGFSIIALSISVVLVEASRALYYGLSRALGVQNPGGVSGDLPSILVGPVSTVIIFGGAWLFMRRSVMRDALQAEAPRQAGVRRLYTHLVALFGAAALATGVAGLLWTLGDMALGQGVGLDPNAWRNQVSLFVTMVVVGLTAWATHWRPAPPPSERLALSRRFYLFVAMLFGMLGLLGSGAYFIHRLLSLLLGAESGSQASEIARALSMTVVALAVAGYHWRVLRLDGAQRELEMAPAPSPEPLTSPPLVVEIVGASEPEVRLALESLPGSARYSLRAMDPATGPE